MRTPPPPPRSASAQVVAHVKDAIRAGRLSPGQRLLESELTGRLAVSRGPVREALAQLQVEGFVDLEPHRGARVHQISRGELTDLYAVRGLLAAESARLAAARVDEGPNRARLRAALDRQRALRGTHDIAAYAEANLELHGVIEEMSGNPALAALLEQLQTRIGPFLRLIQVRSLDRLTDQHIRIAEAVLAGDRRAAARTMRAHMALVLRVVLELPQTWFE